MPRDQHPVGPAARLGPSCTCCRHGRVRVVRVHAGRVLAAACPICDRVAPVPFNGPVMTTDAAFVPAPRPGAPAT